MVSLSPAPMAQPPRSNPFRRSSSDAPPFPCITPSTVTCVMVVSFTGSSFLSCASFPLRPQRGADLIGRAWLRRGGHTLDRCCSTLAGRVDDLDRRTVDERAQRRRV